MGRKRRSQEHQGDESRAPRESKGGIGKKLFLWCALFAGPMIAMISGDSKAPTNSIDAEKQPSVAAKMERLSPEARCAVIEHEIEQRGLGKIIWNHPTGGMKDPLIIVPYCHPTSKGEVPDMHQLHDAFLVLMICAENGNETIAVEGLPHGETFPRVNLMDTAHDGTQQELSTGAVSFLCREHPRSFEALINGQPPAERSAFIGGLLARCVEGKAQIIGAEDPARIDEITHMATKTFPEKFARYSSIMEAVQNNTKEGGRVTVGVRADGKVVIGTAVFDRKEFEEALLWAAKGDAQEEEHQHREKFLLEHPAHPDVVLFGTDHASNFLKVKNAERSIGVVVLASDTERQANRNAGKETAQRILAALNQGQ